MKNLATIAFFLLFAGEYGCVHVPAVYGDGRAGSPEDLQLTAGDVGAGPP